VRGKNYENRQFSVSAFFFLVTTTALHNVQTFVAAPSIVNYSFEDSFS